MSLAPWANALEQQFKNTTAEPKRCGGYVAISPVDPRRGRLCDSRRAGSLEDVMRDALAERLLAKVMNWSPADVARERPILQALALLKYDEYQQFSPGMRFVESLALWLEQFEADERQIAYDFIRSRLVFLSEAEMAHFAAVMYPDFL